MERRNEKPQPVIVGMACDGLAGGVERSSRVAATGESDRLLGGWRNAAHREAP